MWRNSRQRLKQMKCVSCLNCSKVSFTKIARLNSLFSFVAFVSSLKLFWQSLLLNNMYSYFSNFILILFSLTFSQVPLKTLNLRKLEEINLSFVRSSYITWRIVGKVMEWGERKETIPPGHTSLEQFISLLCLYNFNTWPPAYTKKATPIHTLINPLKKFCYKEIMFHQMQRSTDQLEIIK